MWYMKVLVDDREALLLKYLGKNYPVQKVRLPLGDMIVARDNGALVVERKTVADLIASIKSNRLWSQLLRLMKAKEILGYRIRRRLLVIQGSFWGYTNVSSINEERFWGMVFGSLISINFVYDTPCIVCENNRAFEIFLRILMKREEEGKDDALPHGRWRRKPISRLPAMNIRQYVLDAIPSIGEAHAKSLLSSYGTISDIAGSSMSRLMEVPGIGKKRAQKIYEVFH